METAPSAHWCFRGVAFYSKNPYRMCLNLTLERFPGNDFSVNIPEQIFAADGRKAGFLDFQPEWSASGDQLLFDWCRPAKAAISVALAPSPLALAYTITVRNLQDKPWENTCAFPCFNQSAAPDFEDRLMERTYIPTRSGLRRLFDVPRVKPPSGRPFQIFLLQGADDRVLPDFGCTNPLRASAGYIITESRDGAWSLGMASESPVFLFNNQEISCIHACPGFGDLRPGEQRTRSGEIRFIKGKADDLARLFQEKFSPSTLSLQPHLRQP